MDGNLLSSPIFVHFLITLLLVLFILIVYAIHAKLFIKLWHWCYNLFAHVFVEENKRKEKPPVESRFRMTGLLRWMLLPSVISVALIFFFLSYHQSNANNQGTSSSPAAAIETTAQAAAEIPAGDGAILANTLVKIAQVFSMEITVDEVWKLYAGTDSEANIPASPDKLAVFWISFVMAAAPILTLITAASFFRSARFWTAMLIPFPGKRFFVFSELNERSRKYALCLSQKHRASFFGKKRTVRPYIVFCCDDNTADESMEMGRVLLMKRSITNLHILGKWRFHFYLISNNESLNVEQASLLRQKYQNRQAHILCVSNGLVTEHAVDNLNKNILTLPWNKNRCHAIELIDEKLRVVYQDLYENPLLTKAFLQKVDRSCVLSDDCLTRQIRILALGAGRVGELVIRTMMWYCQLPGYNVHITVADQEEKKVIEHRIFRHNTSPEDVKKLEIFSDRVQIEVLEKQNLLTNDLESILSGQAGKMPVFHAVYVCLGEDNRNYQAALKVRRFYLRKFPSWGCPEIRTVIWDDTLTALVENSIQLKGRMLFPGERRYTNYCLQGNETFVREDHDNRMCPIHLMGSMKKTLLDFEALKMDALRYHTYYCNPSLSTDEQKALRNDWHPLFDKEHLGYQKNSQSVVRSNHAVALHGYAKLQWQQHRGKAPATEIDKDKLAESEHIRWSIFKLMEGCYPPPADLVYHYLYHTPNGQDADKMRGYHVCLVPWSQFKIWANAKEENNPCQEQFAAAMDSHLNILSTVLSSTADEELNALISKHKELFDQYKNSIHQPQDEQTDAPSPFERYKNSWAQETLSFRKDIMNDDISHFMNSIDEKIRMFDNGTNSYNAFFNTYWIKQQKTDKNLALFSLLLEENRKTASV